MAKHDRTDKETNRKEEQPIELELDSAKPKKKERRNQWIWNRIVKWKQKKARSRSVSPASKPRKESKYKSDSE
jgi:hypothetical protein